jgi:hypothetical protein
VVRSDDGLPGNGKKLEVRLPSGSSFHDSRSATWVKSPPGEGLSLVLVVPDALHYD